MGRREIPGMLSHPVRSGKTPKLGHDSSEHPSQSWITRRGTGDHANQEWRGGLMLSCMPNGNLPPDRARQHRRFTAALCRDLADSLTSSLRRIVASSPYWMGTAMPKTVAQCFRDLRVCTMSCDDTADPADWLLCQ